MYQPLLQPSEPLYKLPLPHPHRHQHQHLYIHMNGHTHKHSKSTANDFNSRLLSVFFFFVLFSFIIWLYACAHPPSTTISYTTTTALYHYSAIYPSLVSHRKVMRTIHSDIAARRYNIFDVKTEMMCRMPMPTRNHPFSSTLVLIRILWHIFQCKSFACPLSLSLFSKWA